MLIFRKSFTDDLEKSIGGKFMVNTNHRNRTLIVSGYRSDFSLPLFSSELRAYMSLKSLQGNYMAKFLGHFTVSFMDRELKEDRTVKILMLNVLRGTSLENTPASKLPTVDPKRVREQVLDILDVIYRHDIFFPQISLRKFLISEEDPVPKLFGFSVSFDAKEYGTAEKRKIHISISLAGIRVSLSHLGYNDLDNHIKSPPRSHPSR